MRKLPVGWALLGLMAPLLLCLSCRTAERTMLGVSRLKSPVTVVTPGLNKPFTRQELLQARIDPATLKPACEPAPGLTNAQATARSFDDYADLRQKEVCVLVCLSGGGARAARMAAHTLALLEQKYNQRFQAQAAAEPLAQRINAWSSISGGSVYSSFVAVELQDHQARTNSFANLVNRSRPRWATKDLGGMSSFYYLWPGNLGYAPLMQLTTEWDTLHLFARNLALFHENSVPFLPLSKMRKLGELPAEPRFFFNATCRETARPFIFTQSVVHRDLSGDPLSRLGSDPLVRWISGQAVQESELREPFNHASTLEDLGSPPQRFPLAFAAMASAAFPGVFDPLPLRRFGFATNAPNGGGEAGLLWWLHSQVSIADGGLYDNTGLSTALSLVDYLRTSAGPKPGKIVLLAIDADNTVCGYTGPSAPSKAPWRLDLPFRGALAAVETMTQVYNNQQLLVQAAIQHRIEQLEKAGVLEFYPVRLTDAAQVVPPEKTSLRERLNKLQQSASKQAWSRIEDLSLFGIVADIPTDFVISRQEDEDLKETVGLLLERGGGGTTNGCGSLGERFVQAVGPGR